MRRVAERPLQPVLALRSLAGAADRLAGLVAGAGRPDHDWPIAVGPIGLAYDAYRFERDLRQNLCHTYCFPAHRRFGMPRRATDFDLRHRRPLLEEVAVSFGI